MDISCGDLAFVCVCACVCVCVSEGVRGCPSGCDGHKAELLIIKRGHDNTAVLFYY